MRHSFGIAIVVAASAVSMSAADETALQQPQIQLPPPPPLVPERQRPRQPLFPVPPLPQFPAPRLVPPTGRTDIVLAPQMQCGMRQVPVSPDVDPKFVRPVPNPESFTIRKMPVPCR